ncbi:carbamoyl phosphate synthase large subunit [Mycobacterium sp. CBMA293]|nr:ATP-grasp domain-containing protein [Mycolicibacterium sp. CBMA 213]MUL46242.1 carbamoyl phosphate synthase large subunit [Mycolicibacterium sp. CBMA 360]MUL58707.1 carbamoyl phosphate synthase large subunit [Mycolicibacterium sp. CBMA 335]MUL69101.1 carbamoyl phosphate synthase large subunit [Mycolicibacterium sp. CBMA 311]MUL94065.1 carbamoyl phosphate synthase large subunit [Mycolicibacterium sp. CBMA 230]MUM11194.1 carbamoyl phosphate synthase large subunit [Mycolicibacterium sp. CBMA 2
MAHSRCADRANILILSAGRRVELVQEFQAATRRLLPGSRVMAADALPEGSAACHIADAYAQLPRVGDPAYEDDLIALCDRLAIGLIVPTIDTELHTLAGLRDAMSAHGTYACVSDAPLVTRCRDKRLTGAVFNAIDIPYPRIYDRHDVKFPCFCKPFDGSSSVGVEVLHSAAHLTDRQLSDPKVMFMELIGSDFHEYTADAYYDRSGQLKCLVPRERLEVRSGEVSKGITHGSFVYRFLWPRLQRLAGVRGCCTIQVFGNPVTGAVVGLEINPRFGGGYPLTAAAGANYAEWLIREYLLGADIPVFDGWERNLLMLRYDAKVLVHAPD